MKESFAATKPQTEQKNGEGVIQSDATVAVRAPRTLANPGQTAGLIGEFNSRDLQWPNLKLVGKQSELVNEGFTPGTYVFNKEQTVADGKKAMRVIVLSMAKEYWQKLPQGSTARPMVFKTISEVHDAGGSNEFGDNDSIPFQDCGRCTVLVESETEKPGFIFEAGGKYYAPAIWFLSGTAYGAAGRKFATDSQITLRKEGLSSRFYDVTSKIESNSKGSWFLPVVRLTTDAVPTDLIDQVKTLFS